MSKHPIRVLIAEDSLFTAHLLQKILEDAPDIEVVGVATTGKEAVEMATVLRPDVITMDYEMPEMNGLEALEIIMKTVHVPVIMCSLYTRRGAEITTQALLMGAVDVVQKPRSQVELPLIQEELLRKIRAAVRSQGVRALKPLAEPPQPPPKPQLGRLLQIGDPVIVIAASTGGPRTLATLLQALPPDLGAAILIVQHMPPHFTHTLAHRLDLYSALRVAEAEEGMRLTIGSALLAPGGVHTTLLNFRTIRLTLDPPVNHVRPAADVTMRSVARFHGERAIGVVLTGMGEDGREGARAIKQAGGTVIAQDESSSVVYGMPRAVVEAGLADYVQPPEEIAQTLIDLIRRMSRHDTA